MASYIVPTLTYPVGGEVFTDREITIQWEEPSSQAFNPGEEPSSQTFESGIIYWYEIFYSEDVEDIERVWFQIASIPTGNTSFNWKIKKGVQLDECRIGMRVVDHMGNRQPMTMTATSFALRGGSLPVPMVFSPVDNGKYFYNLAIIFDKSGLEGQSSKRASYQVYYRNDIDESDWILLRGNIPVDTEVTYIDTSDFAVSGVYSFKFELVDGNTASEPVFVNNVTISIVDYFVIDTLPPIGSIKILNNQEYIRDRELVLELKSYDETTGVDVFQIVEKNIDDLEADLIRSPFYPDGEVVSWTIVGVDGVKLIQSVFRDLAGNIVLPDEDTFYFRTYKNLFNREVTSLLIVENGSDFDRWIAFGGVAPELYLNGNSTVGTVSSTTERKYLPVDTNGGEGSAAENYSVDGLDDVEITFDFYGAPDQMVITDIDGETIYDTGPRSGTDTIALDVSTYSVIIITMTGSSGSAWEYAMSSPQEYPADSDFYQSPEYNDRPVGEVASMEIFGDVLYMGVTNKQHKGVLQRYVGGHIETIYEIDDNDSIINDMVVFNNVLFMGCDCGKLFSFDGVTIATENTFNKNIHRLGTDGKVMYVFLENSNDIYIVNVNTAGEYEYNQVTL